MVIRPGKSILFVLLILAAMFLPCTIVRGACLVADLPAPVQLPDGRVFPAGELAVCTTGSVGSGFSLREIRVDGAAVGVFATRAPSHLAATAREQPFLRFDRFGGACVLRLEAFGEVAGGALAVFHLPRAARPRDDLAAIDLLCRGREPAAEGPVEIAAARQ